jgi:Leucine-rich repeat (LRR) protein
LKGANLLNNLAKLRQLQLIDCEFMTKSSPPLFNNLEIVKIHNSENFQLENLINTKYLSLATKKKNCKISKFPATMSNLVNLKIQGFEFERVNSWSPNVDIFENLTNIKHLDLSHNGFICWNPLWSKSLVNLKSLNLNESTIFKRIDNELDWNWKNDLAELSALINLEYLFLRKMGKFEIDAQIFANLKHLKYLDISENNSRSWCERDANDMTTVEVEQNISTHLENLEYLIMDSTRNLTRFIFKKFKFDKLKKLCISSDFEYNETEFFTKVFFSKLPNSLVELSLTRIFGLGLYDKCLSHLTNLKYLDLSNNSLSFDGENLFASQQKLEVLHLNRNDFRSPSKNWFNGLDSLRTLNLYINEITDFNIECVEKMKNLEYICLDYTISNADKVKKTLEDKNIICELRFKKRCDSCEYWH